MLNFSQASENNKIPILETLRPNFKDVTEVLEIGSGSGQHAFYFTEQLPQLIWQPTEMPQNVAALSENIERYGSAAIRTPLGLDVREHPWPITHTECVYSANTLHIMAWSSAPAFFKGVGAVLNPGGMLFVYGPFKYGGDFTTGSNAAFDEWLKIQNPASGIRDFEAVNDLAEAQGLTLANDYALPANNQLLVFKRS